MNPFLAEIRIFAGNFAPTGWAFCNGQLLPITQNTALFSLVGIAFGGDGKTTFALPDLRGRAPMQWGNGLGLSIRDIGEAGGVERATLNTSEIPTHTHRAMGTGVAANQVSPAGGVWAAALQRPYNLPGAADAAMNAKALQSTGGTLPHNNMMPYLTLTFIISLQGVFPQRS